MKAIITLNQLNKARTRALRRANRMEHCRFDGMPFYLLRVANALRSAGFEIDIILGRIGGMYSFAECGLSVNFKDGRYPEFTVSQVSEYIGISEKFSNLENIRRIKKLINDACQQLADHLNQYGEPQNEEL